MKDFTPLKIWITLGTFAGGMEGFNRPFINQNEVPLNLLTGCLIGAVGAVTAPISIPAYVIWYNSKLKKN